MSTHRFMIDGHLDLSMNAIDWNRDLRCSVQEIRDLEKGMNDKRGRENGTVSFASVRAGNIGLCFATLIARYAKPSHPLGGWRSPEQAWSMVRAQLAWYNEMERQGELSMIKTRQELDDHLARWNTNKDDCGIGFLLTLEGADSIVTFDHLHLLFENGLRAIGPAHYGPGTYAFGTNSEGGIGEKGRQLLEQMDQLGMALDVTHLCDTSFWEAIDVFQGTVWASHSNCRSLVNHNRQFTDDQIKALVDRDAVIGMALDTWMMVPGWKKGAPQNENPPVYLDHMINHMDHICALIGNTNHVAIGTDLDGGFGKEQSPLDIDTIADMQKLNDLLAQRGYSEDDIESIFYRNWMRKLNQVLT